jgi:hypothetical protein
MATSLNINKEYDPKGLDPYDYDYEPDSGHTFLGKIRQKFIQLLWFSAGADRQILMRCPHSERVKYLGLGGVVLATALLAFSSGSYAFFTVFGPKVSNIFDPSQQSLSIFNSADYLFGVFESIFAGSLWALVIFNLDRFIVTSTGHGDGTETITKDEFKNGIPRIILAIVVAICVAKPLEIRIFKTELDAEINELQHKKEETLAQNAKNKYEFDKKIYGEKLERLRAENQAKESQIADFETRLANERAGIKVNGTTGKNGEGRVTAGLNNQLNQIKESNTPTIIENRKAIVDIDNALMQAKKDYEIGKKEAHIQSLHVDGLAQRIKLSHEKFPAESFFLTLMLIFIEITPVFIKMQFIRGPYDYLTENQSQIVLAKFGIQEKYQTTTDEYGKAKQNLVPVYHVAESISDYEIGKLNIERNLAKAAHKIFQEEVTSDIKSNPEKYMPNLKKAQNSKRRNSTQKA